MKENKEKSDPLRECVKKGKERHRASWKGNSNGLQSKEAVKQ